MLLKYAVYPSENTPYSPSQNTMKYARRSPPEFLRRILRRRATTPVSTARARELPQVAGVSQLSLPIVVRDDPEANSATTTANLSTRKAVRPQPIAVAGLAPVDGDEQVREFCARRTVIAGHADVDLERRAIGFDPVFSDSNPIMAVLFLVQRRHRRVKPATSSCFSVTFPLILHA